MFQNMIVRPGSAARLQQELYPELGTRDLRVLDIGCGPAAFYARYGELGGLHYVGIEPNEHYVNKARERFSGIELHAGTVPQVKDQVLGEFDLVILEGVLHHLDDDAAIDALRFGAEHLATGGRLVTMDPVLLERQHPIAMLVARSDRGRHVRKLDELHSLARKALSPEGIRIRTLSGQLRIPYDHAVIEHTKTFSGPF